MLTTIGIFIVKYYLLQEGEYDQIMERAREYPIVSTALPVAAISRNESH